MLEESGAFAALHGHVTATPSGAQRHLQHFAAARPLQREMRSHGDTKLKEHGEHVEESGFLLESAFGREAPIGPSKATSTYGGRLARQKQHLIHFVELEHPVGLLVLGGMGWGGEEGGGMTVIHFCNG